MLEVCGRIMFFSAGEVAKKKWRGPFNPLIGFCTGSALECNASKLTLCVHTRAPTSTRTPTDTRAHFHRYVRALCVYAMRIHIRKRRRLRINVAAAARGTCAGRCSTATCEAGQYYCGQHDANHDLPRAGVDLYVGTYPCLPWSRRGQRTGFE